MAGENITGQQDAGGERSSGSRRKERLLALLAENGFASNGQMSRYELFLATQPVTSDSPLWPEHAAGSSVTQSQIYDYRYPNHNWTAVPEGQEFPSLDQVSAASPEAMLEVFIREPAIATEHSEWLDAAQLKAQAIKDFPIE